MQQELGPAISGSCGLSAVGTPERPQVFPRELFGWTCFYKYSPPRCGGEHSG
jgi:hypothetical protein